MKTIKNVLLESNSSLTNLIQTAQLLSELNEQLHTWIDPNLASHCQVSHIDNGMLILIADSSAYATKLRFMSQTLLKQAQALPYGKNIHTILVKVSVKRK